MSQQPDNNNNDNFFNKNPIVTFAIFSIIIILLFKSIAPESDRGAFLSGSKVTKTKDVSYSELKELVKEGKLTYVGVSNTDIKAVEEDGHSKTIYLTKRVHNDESLITLLDEKGVEYGGFDSENWFTKLIFEWILPIFIFFAIWMFLIGRVQKNMGGGVLGMGKSNKLINSEKPDIKFDDMAGGEEAKEEVKELVDFLKYPKRYIDLGAKIPKGVLLVGPPGTGKTLLAKAVAGEADVPFLAVSGSSFIEMFVGVGASRVRDLFEEAKKQSPAIIFIDEIDAIGKSRSASPSMGGNDEREQTLNQLLAEMDGFDSASAPVIVLAATNRPEVLDAALLRPGRFDRQVLVDKPDFKGRVEILKVHIKDIKIHKDVDLEEIARMTAGLAGADLANIINEAALLAGRLEQPTVEQANFLEAVERAIAGLEKKSRRISPKEKKIVAYHESGHALMAETTKGATAVTKVSIIPRGLAALGYTLHTPEENKYLMQKHELVAEVDVLLGGRAAEEVFLKEISTGAGNDLERATDIIKSMVSFYGMSEVAGLMVLEKQRNNFLGGGFGSAKEYSEKMAQEMDEYIKRILHERYTIVKDRLQLYSSVIESLVEVLFDKEVVEGDEVRKIVHAFEEENSIVNEKHQASEAKKETSIDFNKKK